MLTNILILCKMYFLAYVKVSILWYKLLTYLSCTFTKLHVFCTEQKSHLVGAAHNSQQQLCMQDFFLITHQLQSQQTFMQQVCMPASASLSLSLSPSLFLFVCARQKVLIETDGTLSHWCLIWPFLSAPQTDGLFWLSCCLASCPAMLFFPWEQTPPSPCPLKNCPFNHLLPLHCPLFLEVQMCCGSRKNKCTSNVELNSLISITWLRAMCVCACVCMCVFRGMWGESD